MLPYRSNPHASWRRCPPGAPWLSLAPRNEGTGSVDSAFAASNPRFFTHPEELVSGRASSVILRSLHSSVFVLVSLRTSSVPPPFLLRVLCGEIPHSKARKLRVRGFRCPSPTPSSSVSSAATRAPSSSAAAPTAANGTRSSRPPCSLPARLPRAAAPRSPVAATPSLSHCHRSRPRL